MPTFKSIPTNLPIRQDSCSLVDTCCRMGGLVALFSFSHSGASAHDPQAVRVIFDRIIVMRWVDEMVYSLEERGKDIGITREGFAYEVIDSPFLETLTEGPQLTYKNPRQYTFISLSECLDVISNGPPQFDLIDLKPWLRSNGFTWDASWGTAGDWVDPKELRFSEIVNRYDTKNSGDR